MRLSLFGLIFLFLVSVTARSQAASDNESSLTRAQSVINAFQVMCTRELPNFEHIDANATAMRMQLEADDKTASPGNTVTHSKSWMGSLTTGPFVLFLDEMSGAKGTSTSCAIVGDVPDLDAFRADLLTIMLLPAVPPPEMRGDGSRSFIWDGILGPGTTLILRDFKPSGKPGVMLKLLSMIGHR
jgi:hypothetical protein